jgi:hypothetical protein
MCVCASVGKINKDQAVRVLLPFVLDEQVLKKSPVFILNFY